jgi:4-diphosphocytidyl-2-C-methyl-D-erythritol kinase
VIVFPNSKINLGLHIIRKRSDGFHDLETVFYPLPFTDILEIIESRDTDDISFTASGMPVAGDRENNLCIKAYHLLKKDHPDLPSILMHLHKTIPMGAGLGGGSADGAYALKLLNDKFQLGLSNDQLINYALQLGSDCPFFIIGKPCFATGRGEILEPIAIDFSQYSIVLVNPGIHVNTGHAFSQVIPAVNGKSIKTILEQPIATWKDELKNDFEEVVARQHPEVSQIKNELYANGAVYASMSGSGSTVYGIFEKGRELKWNFPAGYFIKYFS